MLDYKAIEIFASEAARHGKRPLADAVLRYLRDLKIAARCMVTRGVAGCYENGEMATERLEVLSMNMPIRITIVLPAAEAERVANGLEEMIDEGIVSLHNLNVLHHKTRNAFFPRQLMVRDVMTPDPKSVLTTTSLYDAVTLLLSAVFTGLPVLDARGQVAGVVTQGDLIRQGALPLRLRLLSESDENHRTAVLKRLAKRRVDEIMTSPAVVIQADRPLAEAVDRMLSKGVKRLPVVDAENRLTGILSRLDIFRTVMREAPDWSAFQAQQVHVGNLRTVGEIVRRDTHTVSADTPIDAVIRTIHTNDIQRVAVTDDDGKLIGVIADRDLLRFFQSHQPGIRHMLSKITHAYRQGAPPDGLQRRLAETTAGMVMTSDLVTATEAMTIEAAIGVMVDRGLKRLPVIDDEGRFKGMISRKALLRSGFDMGHRQGG